MKKTRWMLGTLPFLCLLLLLCSCGSGPAHTPESSRKIPLDAGVTATFYGMDKKDAGFDMELELYDTLRGEEANRIFLAEDIWGLGHEVPEGQEMLIVKLRIRVLESKDGTVVPLSWDDVTMFKLVSENGATYDTFLTRRYVQNNLFSDLYPDGEQVAHLFFLVDVEDENPRLVFEPMIKGGVWFQTDPSQQSRKEPIDVAAWLEQIGEHPDYAAGQPQAEEDLNFKKPSNNLGGTLTKPLPVGEMGFAYGTDFLKQTWAVEMELLAVERGAAVLADLESRDAALFPELKEGEEFVRAKFRINALAAPDVLRLAYTMPEILHANGQAVANNWGAITTDDTLDNLYPGGTQEGWVYFVVDQGANVRFSLQFYDDLPRVWFTTDPDATLQGATRYESQFTSPSEADPSSAEEGSYRNPWGMGVEKKLGNDADALHVEVQDVMRGEEARSLINSNGMYAVKSTLAAGNEVMLVKLRVKVDSTTNETGIDLDGGSFILLDSNYRLLDTNYIYASYITEGLKTVYPGDYATGYIGFTVPADSPRFVLGYNANSYDISQPSMWFTLQENPAPPPSE